MITGFNTDVEHEGIVYHVQTEDKGLSTPLILSLIYVGGAILASKRSPYNDLIASGFNTQALAERLQRQHKLICAAISAGRIEDLKRMNKREAEEEMRGAPGAGTQIPPATEAPAPVVAASETSGQSKRATPASPKPAGRPASSTAKPGQAAPRTSTFGRREGREGALSLNLLEERELHAGEVATLRVRASKGSGQGDAPAAHARVVVKVLGTEFRPLILETLTDQQGVAIVEAGLPHFRTGRAAVLISVAFDGQEAELRRIIHNA